MPLSPVKPPHDSSHCGPVRRPLFGAVGETRTRTAFATTPQDSVSTNFTTTAAVCIWMV